MKICKTEDCTNHKLYAKGLCRACYTKQWKSPNKCSITGCDRPLYGKGHCQMHWQRSRKHDGDVGPSERIRGADGQGTLDANGYRVITINTNERVLEHRYVMEQYLGRKLFPGENVHHINGDRADNRIENLELWNTSQPPGQRVEDKIKWATELLQQYGKIIT